MNKLQLKEQKQSKEEKAKKKEKAKPKTIRITKFIIQQRLLKHFQNHIGESSKTSQEEIFQAVTGVNTLMVNSFARFYFWKSIEEVIRKLRRTNECFVIKKFGHYFVLQHQTEADYYRKLCDKAIEGLNKAELRADDWVEKEKWKEFSRKDYGHEEQEEEETPREETPEESIQNKLDKAKRRVVKLWKGEK